MAITTLVTEEAIHVYFTGYYYTIIDFNEVDIRIYLPEKVIIHRGRKTEVNITFKGR